MDGTNAFGSYVGQDASARTSPLFGSTITMAPRFAFAANAFSASSCRCKSRLVTTLYPGSGGVTSFSEVFRPDCFVVIDNSVRVSARFSGVTNNLTGNLSVRINPDINRSHHHFGRQLILDSFVFLRRKIGCDLKRHDTPVAVMAKDRLIGDPEPAS